MKSFTTQSMRGMFLAAALLTLPACSDNSPEPKAERSKTAAYELGVPGKIAVDTTTVTANIVSVFPSDRTVVLDLPGGERETVKCGPEIVNFDQFRPGDQVKVTLTQQVVTAMGSESDRPDTAGDPVVALAPKGAQPGAVMANTRQVTATITAIDIGHHTATLEFPDGRTHKVAVRHDIDLTEHKAGEKVVIRTTDIVALRVEKMAGR